jgi:hypothetical protein
MGRRSSMAVGAGVYNDTLTVEDLNALLKQ